MLRTISLTLLLSVVLPAWAASPTVAEIAAAEAAARSQALATATAAVKAAETLLEAGEYAAAREQLLDAELLLKESSRSKPQVLDQLIRVNRLLMQTHGAWAAALIRQGDELLKQEKFDEAEACYRRAKALTPQRDAIRDLLRTLEARREQADFRRAVREGTDGLR